MNSNKRAQVNHAAGFHAGHKLDYAPTCDACRASIPRGQQSDTYNEGAN